MDKGQLVFVERQENGDYLYPIKIALEHQPLSTEHCRNCHRGELERLGVVIQMGFLDDHYLTVMRCEHCCAFTVFSYHVPSEQRVLPASGGCDAIEND